MAKIQTQHELVKKYKDLGKFIEPERGENYEDKQFISKAIRFHSRPKKSEHRIKTEEKKDLFSRVNSQLIESDCRNDTLYQV